MAETVKDLWNEEIIRGVNWVYGIQWNTIAKRTANGVDSLLSYIKSSTSS